jgi:hypothetical protein
MSKGNEWKELLRLGNFIVYGITDKTGRTVFMEIRAAGGSWMMRVDDGTWTFELMKKILSMSVKDTNRELWKNHIHGVMNILYQFGTCGIPVGMLTGILGLIDRYVYTTMEESVQPTDKEEKETLKDMKREVEVNEELKNIENNGKDKEE